MKLKNIIGVTLIVVLSPVFFSGFLYALIHAAFCIGMELCTRTLDYLDKITRS